MTKYEGKKSDDNFRYATNPKFLWWLSIIILYLCFGIPASLFNSVTYFFIYFYLFFKRFAHVCNRSLSYLPTTTSLQIPQVLYSCFPLISWLDHVKTAVAAVGCYINSVLIESYPTNIPSKQKSSWWVITLLVGYISFKTSYVTNMLGKQVLQPKSIFF